MAVLGQFSHHEPERIGGLPGLMRLPSGSGDVLTMRQIESHDQPCHDCSQSDCRKPDHRLRSFLSGDQIDRIC